MSGFSNPILGGGGALVYPSIHSPNFNIANPLASPTPSWGVLKSGLAYFFGLVLTGGTFTGTDYILSTAGAFWYNGTPGLGTLIQSITPPSTSVDSFGNAIIGTNTTYQKISPTSWQAIAYQGNEIQFFTATSPAGPWAGTGNFITFSPSGPDGILINANGGTVQLGVLNTGVQVAGALLKATAGLSVTGGTTTDTETVTGVLTANGGTPATPSSVKTDSWNNMALNAGFAAGVPAPQYKLMPDQTVMLRGIVTLTAGQAANTVFATLGSSYVAAHGTQFTTRNTLSGYAAGNGSVQNAGGASTLAIVVAGVTGNVVQLDGVRYSTDA